MQIEMTFQSPGNNENGSIPLQLGNFFLKLQNKKKFFKHTGRENNLLYQGAKLRLPVFGFVFSVTL